MMSIADLFENIGPDWLESQRREMRDFYPYKNQMPCQDEKTAQHLRNIWDELEKWFKDNPDLPVFAAKKKIYRTLAEKFRPVIFRHGPFYFEAGINGGWGMYPPGRAMNGGLAERFLNTIPQERLERHRARCRERFTLCCGPFIDSIHHIPPYRTIFDKGFKGVYEEALAEYDKCTTRDEKLWFEAIFAGLEAIRDIQYKYRDEAERILREEELTPQQKKNMVRIAESAAHAPWEPPRNFFEGLNTLWFVREILSLVDGLNSHSLGHPDAVLADLYEQDIAAGKLTPEEAFELIGSFLLIAECHHDNMHELVNYSDHELEIPVTLGGCDTKGRPVFNDLTRMFILAHRKLNLAYPKIHCRASASSPAEYFAMLADDIHMGRAVHTIFNDDITIPTLQSSGRTPEEARRYICGGCWDIAVDGCENPYGAHYFSLARILEATIYPDPELYRSAALDFQTIDENGSYEDMKAVIFSNIRNLAESWLDDLTASEGGAVLAFPHPVYSACLENCLTTRRDEACGGAKYSPSDLDMAFLGNLVDSMLAIKDLCFRKKVCTLGELLASVRSNWQVKPELRTLVLQAPHWGDDGEESTALALEVQELLSSILRRRRNGRGGTWELCGWIYREYRFWGEKMKALPDGRYDGDYLAQALNPSSFRNVEDVTTTLNAISRLDHYKFHSSNVNLTLQKDNVSLEGVAALLRSFCALKIHMLQLNCFNREELEDAMIHPERHRELIVKVCGFSVRFVALSPEWQKAVLARNFF